MNAVPIDNFLSVGEVEELTGIERTSPTRQRNFLTKKGIHCFINEQQRVIVTWSWVQAAGRPVTVRRVKNETTQDEPNFKALQRHGQKQKRQG